MSRSTRHGWWLAALLILAFAVRMGFAVWWQQRLDGERFGFGDSESYWQLASAMAHGKAYAYPTPDTLVFRAPGYPLLLSSVMWRSGGEPPVMAARAVTALVAALVVGGVYWLGCQLFDARVGLLAASCAAIYPGLVALGGLVLSDAPFATLVPVQLACWNAGWQATSRKQFAGWLLLAGATAGLATLLRPSWLLFTPFALAIGLLTAERRRHLQAAPWLMLGLCLVMSPWWIRNAAVTGRFVPTTLQVGASLYDGLNPAATGGSNMDFVPQLTEQLRIQEAAQPIPDNGTFEWRLNRFERNAALDWARRNPGEVLRLAAIKFSRMWNVWPNEPQFRGPLMRMAVLLSYGPLLVLGLWGYVRLFARCWPYQMLLLPAVYLTLLHTIFVSSLRYREPAMLPLMIPAAWLVLDLMNGAKSRPLAERK